MNINEIEDAQKVKSKLDSVSESYCPVMWKHATINFNTGTSKSCCHHPFREMSLSDFDSGHQLHDTKENRKQRARVLNGEKPKDCNLCWWIEDQGHDSDRINWSTKAWMAPFVDKLIESPTSDAKAPSWLELNFSPVCNLKCSYCSPIFSTKWTQEIKIHGPYPTSPGHNDLDYLPGVAKDQKYENEELVNRFWPWFESIYEELRLVKISGGEPFLSKHTMRLLDTITSKENRKLSLSINTNLCPPDSSWNEFIEKLKLIYKSKNIYEFYLHPSIDGWGAQAEYIRHGLDFLQFERNLIQYLTETDGQIIIACTVNNLSVSGMLNFWQKIYDLKQKYARPSRWITVTSEVLIGPAWQNINILPEEYKQYIVNAIEFVEARVTDDHTGFTRVELQSLNRVLDMMKTPPENLQEEKANFYKFFSEHDKRRGTDLLTQFPEMQEFWNECKAASGDKNPNVNL